MADDLRMPKAFLEAFEDTEVAREQASQEARQAMDALAASVEPVDPRQGAERLLEAVSVAPLRYAPFSSRLEQLFDLDEQGVEQQLHLLANPANWRRTGLKGVRRIDVVLGPRLETASASFVRFAPGTHFPRHRHHGFEQVFILEGSYTDDEGVLHGPGNLHEMQESSEHEFWAAESEACIAANVLHGGLRFTRWPAKFFNFFMKR